MNEEKTLAELRERIDSAVTPCLLDGERYEIVFVDDGSSDDSVRVIEELLLEHPNLKLIQLRGNFGKSAALAAGFDEARGDIVFTLDADLQDDPKEIPRFLSALEAGNDLVSGYKQKRHDPFMKVFPSRVFNAMVRRLTGIKLHDVNCGFKAYSRAVIDNVQLYGELHRFVPVLAHWRRFKIGELVVEHHPRVHGVSKFGSGRFLRGLLDLLTVFFLLRYERRPAHFFGVLGGLSSLLGFGVCVYLVVLWFQGEAIGQRPLLTLGVLLIVVGVQFLATGLLAELLIYKTSQLPPYVVRRVITSGQPDSLAETATEPLAREAAT